MRAIPLYAMAHARSGDKGDASNVGVIAYDDRGYEILRDWLTARDTALVTTFGSTL